MARKGGERQPEGRGKPHQRIGDASSAEQDHLASSKRLGQRTRAIGPLIAALEEAESQLEAQAQTADPQNVHITITMPEGNFTFNLPGLKQFLGGMRRAAASRQADHAQSRFKGVRMSAKNALGNGDRVLSDDADSQLRDRLRKLGDNY